MAQDLVDAADCGFESGMGIMMFVSLSMIHNHILLLIGVEANDLPWH